MIKQPWLIPMSSSHHFHRSQDLRVLVKSLFSAIWLWFIENLIDISKLPYIYMYIHIPYIYIYSMSNWGIMVFRCQHLWFSDDFDHVRRMWILGGYYSNIPQAALKHGWMFVTNIFCRHSFHRIHGKIIDDIPSLCIMIYIYIIIFYKRYYILYIIYYIWYIICDI
jgi:hypothetical protein